MSIRPRIRDTHLAQATRHNSLQIVARIERRIENEELRRKNRQNTAGIQLNRTAATASGHNEATLTFDWRPRKLYVKLFNGGRTRGAKRWVGPGGAGTQAEAAPHPRLLCCCCRCRLPFNIICYNFQHKRGKARERSCQVAAAGTGNGNGGSPPRAESAAAGAAGAAPAPSPSVSFSSLESKAQ